MRKSPPASLEACFYRAGEGSHVVETELGRIGVGICYENLLFERIAPSYARALGVPVIFSDRTGPIHTPLPIGMGEFHSSFPGHSKIVDSNGAVKAKMGEEEGVISIFVVEGNV
jgi:N-carbamoylputrescine amidase